jgi:hypothetical protein
MCLFRRYECAFDQTHVGFWVIHLQGFDYLLELLGV